MQSTSKTYRQLQPEDRVTLASLHQQGLGVRAIARVLKRAPATVSRELRRNACEGLYASAHGCRQQHRRRARPARKLDVDGVMFGVVRHCLGLRWSPEQIALTLASTYPKGHAWRVSHETIYNCIYAQPVGELRRELLACLRQARNKRAPRGKGKERRGQIADMLSIHVRPPEVEDRQFPGHWEGELIKGAVGASAVGTLVERTSRLLMLARLPHPKPASAQHVLQAFTDKLNGIAQPMRKTLTPDQGREMARHKELTASTGIAVYFCDPHGPWQRDSNENSNYPEPAFRPGSLRFTALKGGVSNQSQFTIMHPRLEASSIQVKLRKKFRSFTCH
jgi:IS30 family transposase